MHRMPNNPNAPDLREVVCKCSRLSRAGNRFFMTQTLLLSAEVQAVSRLRMTTLRLFWLQSKTAKLLHGVLFPLFKTACTFHKIVENSVYVHHEFQRQGIGSKLLAELVHRAREEGFASVIAVISSDQEASLALHRAAGFQGVGCFHQVGYKFDRYIDVVYLQFRLVNC
jgi:L-amino acid N-acyltransferase YncA